MQLDKNMDGQVTKEEALEYYNGDQAEVDKLFRHYAGANDTISRWPMWAKYHWGEHQRNGLNRRRENEVYAFKQDTWFVTDKNRDMEWSYDELIQDMSDEHVQELFAHFSKDPMSENLTYEEVQGINRELIYDQLNEIQWWAFSKAVRDGENPTLNGPITIDTLDISNGQIQSALQVSTQAELEALFDAVDENDDD